MIRLVSIAALVLAAAAGCGTTGPQPVAFDAANEPCRFCRMTGSDGRSAAQLLAPGEEPLFFDDLGCLRSVTHEKIPTAAAVIFVADHRTGAWVGADRAVFTYNAATPTPMGSHLFAHESAASRDADPDGRAGTATSMESILAGASTSGSSHR